MVSKKTTKSRVSTRKKKKHKRVLSKEKKKRSRRRKKKEETESSSSEEEEDKMDVFKDSSSEEESSGSSSDEDDGVTYRPKSGKKKRKKRKKKKKKKKLLKKITKLRTGKPLKVSRKRKSKKDVPIKIPSSHLILKNENEDSLFAALRESSVSVKELVSDFIDDYTNDQIIAISKLVELVFHSSGCLKAEFSENDVKKKEIHKFIQKFIDLHPETEDYPMVSREKYFKDFQLNFITFWDILIRKLGDKLFDKFFLEYLITWLTSLSYSSHRAFRHTSSVITFTIVDSLIKVVNKDYKKQVRKLKKLIKNSKQIKDRKSEKSLKKERVQLIENIEKLEKVIDEVFEGVFLHRYKDASENIRGLSIICLTNWLISFPDRLFDDQHVKYIGWLLYDKKASIRKLCLESLIKMFKADEDFHGKLASFTTKFLPRFVEMTRDVSVEVCVESLKLLILLNKTKMIEGHEMESQFVKDIERLLFDENRSIRYYSSKYVYKDLKKKIKKSGKGGSKLNLEHLIEFIKKYINEMPAFCSYIVESFSYFKPKLFNNWSKYCGMLIKESEDEMVDEGEDEEDESTESIVIQLLNASVRNVAGKLNNSTSQYDCVKLPKKKKDEDDVDDDEEIEKMTNELITLLPQLIKKYSSDQNKVVDLIEISQFFVLSKYDNNNEHHFRELLKLLNTIFWKHNDETVFDTIGKTYQKFLQTEESYSLKSEARDSYETILRKMIVKLRESIKEEKHINDDKSEEYYDISMGVKRIARFINILEFDLEELYSDMSEMIDAKLKKADISPKCIIDILGILLRYLSRKLDVINEVEERQIQQLSENSKKFLSQLINLINNEKDDYKLQKMAFYYLSDLCVIFKEPNIIDNIDLKLSLCEDDIKILISFFKKSIKIENKKNIVDDEDDDESDDESSKIIAAVSKIMSFLNERIASTVLSHYTLFENENIESAVKDFHKNIRPYFKSSMWSVEFDALKELFGTYIIDEKKSSLDNFIALAQRIGKVYTPFYITEEDKEQILALVRNSIEYVFDDIEERSKFFDGLSILTSRLDDEKIEQIENLLLNKETQATQQLPEDDKSLKEYKELLKELRKKKKKKGKKKKKKDESDDDDDDESDDDDEMKKKEIVEEDRGIDDGGEMIVDEEEILIEEKPRKPKKKKDDDVMKDDEDEFDEDQYDADLDKAMKDLEEEEKMKKKEKKKGKKTDKKKDKVEEDEEEEEKEITDTMDEETQIREETMDDQKMDTLDDAETQKKMDTLEEEDDEGEEGGRMDTLDLRKRKRSDDEDDDDDVKKKPVKKRKTSKRKRKK